MHSKLLRITALSQMSDSDSEANENSEAKQNFYT